MKLGTDSAPDVTIVPGAGVAQSGAPLAMPAAGRVFQLGSYIRALAGFGNLDYRLCIWAWSGSLTGANRLLGQSAVHTIGTASSSPANLTRVVWPLEEPVELGAFAAVLVGVAWETDPAHQMLLGGYAGSGLRYRKDLAAGAPWPATFANAIELTDHDAAGWIEEYAPLSGVWVYRGGEWKQAQMVTVQRDGYSEPARVKVRRSGAWIDVTG